MKPTRSEPIATCSGPIASATEHAVFQILGGNGDRSTRYDTTYAHLPDFDECFAYGRVGNPNARWEFCFRGERLVFKRQVPS